MHIGIITGEYPPMVGGVGAYSHILAHEFARLGHRVAVFTNNKAKGQDVDIAISTGAKTWGLGSLRAIRQWAAMGQFDVVNLQFQTAAYGMSPWIHFLPETIGRVPVVTTFHDLRPPYLFPKAGRMRDWIVMRLARASGGVIVTNQEDAWRLRALSQVTLIPIGSNIVNSIPANFNALSWRTRAGAQDGDFLLAYFGLVNRSKGLETLLQSMVQLRAEAVPVRLVMIGGGAGSSDPTNTDYMIEINRLIDRLDLRSFIHQTGYADDEAVGAYLSASDAVALPFVDGASYRRGSLMAAIHYGCATITTTPVIDVPTFRDGENMLLVKPGDANALAAGIRRIYESTGLRERLRQRAATFAHEFEWSKIAKATTTFFRWVIEECRW